MVKKLGYSLIFILLLVLGGAGWYFSGVIYNGGLNPEFTDSSSIGTAEDRVIVTNITANSIQLNVEDRELARRRENWKKPKPRYKTGILGKYSRLVSSSSQGATTDQI